MASDFIEERAGYLHLSDEEYERAKQTDPLIWKYAHLLLEYGEVLERYWTAEKFMEQLREAEKIAVPNIPKKLDGEYGKHMFRHSIPACAHRCGPCRRVFYTWHEVQSMWELYVQPRGEVCTELAPSWMDDDMGT